MEEIGGDKYILYAYTSKEIYKCYLINMYIFIHKEVHFSINSAVLMVLLVSQNFIAKPNRVRDTRQLFLNWKNIIWIYQAWHKDGRRWWRGDTKTGSKSKYIGFVNAPCQFVIVLFIIWRMEWYIAHFLV